MSSLARQTRWGSMLGAVTIGNILGGSIGNDIITSKSLTLPDYIFTDGGADKDHAGCWPYRCGSRGVLCRQQRHISYRCDIVLSSVANAISELFPPVVQAALNACPALNAAEPAAFQFVNPGWWGVAAGGSSKDILALFANGTGTSLDNSTLTGFVPNQDFLDFSVKAWGGPAYL